MRGLQEFRTRRPRAKISAETEFLGVSALPDVRSPEIASVILAVNEQDPQDRRLLTEHTRRVSKALRILKNMGVIQSKLSSGGNFAWFCMQQKTPSFVPTVAALP
jgi:hypothetical protein